MDWRWRFVGVCYRNNTYEVVECADMFYGKTVFAVRRSSRPQDGVIWYGENVGAAIEKADYFDKTLGVKNYDNTEQKQS